MEYKWHGSVSDDETPIAATLSSEFHVDIRYLVSRQILSIYANLPAFYAWFTTMRMELFYDAALSFCLSLSLSLSTMISGGTAISKQGIVIIA